MLGWGRVKFILQSQPHTHLLALSGLFPILERGSEVSQPMQVSRQDGQLPTEPPMHTGLEGASLHPVHAPIQACTRVSGHVFAHESVHQPSTTTSPRGSSSTRAGWGAACPSARPLHPTLDQSCLHPHFPKPLDIGFPAQLHPKRRQEDSTAPPVHAPGHSWRGSQVSKGCRREGAGDRAMAVPGWVSPPCCSWHPALCVGRGSRGWSLHTARPGSCDIQAGREKEPWVLGRAGGTLGAGQGHLRGPSTP